MDGRAAGHPVGATVAGGLCVTLCATALLLLARADHPFDVGWYAEPVLFVFYLIVGLMSGPVAALILHRGRHPLGWSTGAIALSFAAAACVLAYAFVATERGWPAAGLAVQAFVAVEAFGRTLPVAVLPWVLRTGPMTRTARRCVTAGIALSTVTGLLALTGHQAGAPANPLSLADTRVHSVLLPLTVAALTLSGLLGLVGVAGLVRRWRREPSAGRRAFGVLAGGMVLLFATMTALLVWSPTSHTLVAAVTLPLLFAAYLLVCLSSVVLVLRTWELPIGSAVPRAAVWGLLTASVLVIYVVVVAVATRLLPIGNESAGVVAAGLLAVLVHPLRQALQDRVDQLVHGGAANPVVLLAQLGARLPGTPRQEALPALVDGLRQGLRLGAVDVTGVDPPVQVASGVPRPAGDRLTLPLVVDHRRIGQIEVEAEAGQRLDPRTMRAVTNFVGLVALSLDLVQTNQRLREASRRLGDVRHEERRMLRRELHDHMGPALAGVGLGLAAAQRRLRHDPGGAVRLLADLEAEVERRTEDVRLLARSLLPAQLDDGDLAAALTVLTGRFRSAGLQVRADCTGTEALDARRQVAVYHVAAEALVNAYRHGRASCVDVRVRCGRTGGVTLEVVDDGVGISPQHGRGVGLKSMRERADELSGHLSIEPGDAGSGTRVRMVLP
ncbi:ATP-binding protein [Nocardioides soli]|uniref:Oxygen sensor histidine kinase NreB n=1 Tax=Nocardioides soli TaxID=1036020 RepID=A0A7W4YZ94_9ACTN|nr:signal transduction histidine kinase [Nocardioides soli]